MSGNAYFHPPLRVKERPPSNRATPPPMVCAAGVICGPSMRPAAALMPGDGDLRVRTTYARGRCAVTPAFFPRPDAGRNPAAVPSHTSAAITVRRTPISPNLPRSSDPRSPDHAASMFLTLPFLGRWRPLTADGDDVV
jgi:hypothetical protein